MYDVVICYDFDDETRAAEVERALRAEGISVYRAPKILIGDRYRRTIEGKIRGAKAVVLLWSQQSRDSEWVCDEGELASKLSKLVPAKIDSCDPPLGFNQHLTADLSDWHFAQSGHQEWRRLVNTLMVRGVHRSRAESLSVFRRHRRATSPIEQIALPFNSASEPSSSPWEVFFNECRATFSEYDGAAVTKCRFQALEGVAHEEYLYGLLCLIGHRDLEADVKAAIRWLEKAAADNHYAALLPLGLIFEFGVGQKVNLRKSARYYARASQRKLAGATEGLQRVNNLDIVPTKRWTARLLADVPLANTGRGRR